MMPRGSTWMVFDYGEVISLRTRVQPSMAARLGVDLKAFVSAYRDQRHDYVLGQSDLDYWRAVGNQLGVAVDDKIALELTQQDIEGWLHIDQAAIALAHDLHQAGLPLALLSNLPWSLARAVEQQEWTTEFQHLLFSADLGVAKPASAIWSILADRLQAASHQLYMLDDREYNIEAAEAAGLKGILWRGADDARSILESQGYLGAKVT